MICPTCGGDAAAGSICPRTVTCPRCNAASGKPCKRPSGHRAATLHSGRIRKAEAIDRSHGLIYERKP